MPLFTRKKATPAAGPKPKEDLRVMIPGKETAASSTSTNFSLSSMSIHLDAPQSRPSTYQQPAASASGSSSTLKPPQGHPVSSYSRPSSSGHEVTEIPQVSLKELRGLQTAEDGSFRRPMTAGSERKGSSSTARPTSATSLVNGARSSSSGASRLSASTSAAAVTPTHDTFSHTLPQPYASSPGRPQAHAPTSQTTLPRSADYRHRMTGSASSESSYAASEASDVLYNSSAARSSSGGTTATTPGSTSDREKERTLSLRRPIPVSTSASSSSSSTKAALYTEVERIPVPATIPEVPVQQSTRRPQMGRPASEISMGTASLGSRYDSPALSQTSSMIRKTSSRYTLGDFNFIRTLGTGSFGRVHLVRSCHNTRFYAIKVLNKERVVRMKQVEHTNSEREMLERVRHPFLINLWGTFKDAQNLYMVMDFVSGGELFSLLRKSQRFPDPVAKFFAAEVALALDYLHSLDIIYRDLKPENILLAADGHIKLTDFGFAKYVPDITWTLCGTPDYLAPEVVQSKGYNKSVDWYALGVLIFEMLAGYPPFFTEDSNPMRLYEKIIAGKVRYPSYFTLEAKDLLKNLLTADLTKRFGNLANGSRDIFGHPYFTEVDWGRLYRKEIPAPYVPRVEGDGDSSNFDSYAEIDLSEYGQPGADPHGHLFSCF